MRAFALGLLCWTAAAAQPIDTLTYTVLTAAGDVVAAMRDADVVFLGEIHTDSTAHVLQLRLFEAADTLGRPLALGLEMFERDVQPVLDEYLAGMIRERDMLAATRPWSDYVADYRPLVEHARERGLPVLATNAPGRYVNRVSRLGVGALDVLTDAAKATLPSLPVPPASDTLSAKFNALMGKMIGHGHHAAAASDTTTVDTTTTDASATDTLSAPTDPGVMPPFVNLLAAQNLRDAAMAWTLAEHLNAEPGTLVVHLNGSFHSEGGLGIPEHLARYRPETRMVIVTMRPDRDGGDLAGNDFVIYTGAERGEVTE